MTWFFERAFEIATCEVTRQATHFEIAVRRPGTTDTVIVANNASELLSQLEHTPGALLQDGWRPRGSRC